MEKKILIVGCSFSHKVWDADGNVEESWGDWISNELGEQIYVINLSVPGASNELIKRIVTKKVIEENWDHVIIQWSTIDRWDYPIQLKEHPMFVRYWPMGSNLEGVNEHFYKHYYSVYGAVIDTLENILFTQQLLDSENIPYSMITIGNLFTLSTTIQQIQNLMNSGGDYYELKENVLEKMERIQLPFEDTDSLPFLLKKINYDKFIFSDDERNPMGGGMLEWLYKEKKEYPKINFHFDKTQSYNFYKEFILPKILIPNGLI
jgi:hypothetical protein